MLFNVKVVRIGALLFAAYLAAFILLVSIGSLISGEPFNNASSEASWRLKQTHNCRVPVPVPGKWVLDNSHCLLAGTCLFFVRLCGTYMTAQDWQKLAINHE